MQLTEEQIDEFKSLFGEYDTNGDGTIDKDEIAQLLRCFGQNPSSSDIKEIMEYYSKDHSEDEKRLSFEDFVQLMNECSYELKPDEMTITELRDAFKVFDKDESGKLDAGELRRVMTAIGEDKLEETEFDEMMARSDLNQDGQIDYDEFVNLMTGDLGKI